MAGPVSVCKCAHAHMLALDDDGNVSHLPCELCDCGEFRLDYQAERGEDGVWRRVGE